MPVCPACQTQLPDNARYCQNCGKLVLSRVARRKNNMNNGPAGIGGWLILFAFGLITSMITHFTAGIDYYVEEAYLPAVVFLVLVIDSIVCLIYMMRHSAAFPVMFTFYACASTVSAYIAGAGSFYVGRMALFFLPDGLRTRHTPMAALYAPLQAGQEYI